MQPFILVPIANGSEEMEAVMIVDMLRRAGLQTKFAGDNEIVSCSRGVKLIPDMLLDSINENDEFRGIVIPGGSVGVNALMQNDTLIKVIKNHFSQGRVLGAICAAPTLLSLKKILKARNIVTSHPDVRSQITDVEYSEERVVVDNNLITSRGAGTCLEFCLALIEKFVSEETAKNIAKEIVM